VGNPNLTFSKRKERFPGSGKAKKFEKIDTPSLNQGSVFSLRKCQIRISRKVLPLVGEHFQKKIFHVGGPPPPIVLVDPN
jgi:hypothetical protein